MTANYFIEALLQILQTVKGIRDLLNVFQDLLFYFMKDDEKR